MRLPFVVRLLLIAELGERFGDNTCIGWTETGYGNSHKRLLPKNRYEGVTFRRTCAMLPSLRVELLKTVNKTPANGAGRFITERLKQITEEEKLGASEDDGHSPEINPLGPVPFIFGGTETNIALYPWQGAIQIDVNNVKGSNSNPPDWQLFCGSALISKRWVLTAAHCVEGLFESFNYRVLLGVDDINNSEDAGQIFGVIKAVIHPKWSRTCDRQGVCFPNDIAALKLSRDAVLNPSVRPVKMSSERKSFINYECVQTGFGFTEAGPFIDGKLRKGVIPAIPNDVCKCNWLVASQNAIYAGHLCSFDKNEKSSACMGDSGSPYVCRKEPNEPWILAGLTSFGFVDNNLPLCRPLLPNVNTRVSFHCKWIKRVTGVYCED